MAGLVAIAVLAGGAWWFLIHDDGGRTSSDVAAELERQTRENAPPGVSVDVDCIPDGERRFRCLLTVDQPGEEPVSFSYEVLCEEGTDARCIYERQ